MDSFEIGLPRAIGVDRCDCIVLLWLAQFDSGRHLLFPIDRSLCGIDNGGVSSILPNRCNRMVLQSVTTIAQYQTDDGENAIILLPVVLASGWTMPTICKCLTSICWHRVWMKQN